MYKKKIIIRYSQTAGTDLSDFPVLIDLKDRGLRIKADQNNMNIYFTDSGGKKKLDHEVAAFNPVQGELKAWVRIPKFSNGRDSVIYLVCGFPAEPKRPDQMLYDKTEGFVWDAYYKLVLHLNPDAENQPDSTSNGNDGLVIEKKEQNSYLEIPHSESLNITGSITVEAWLNIEQPKKDTFQIVASKWSHLSGLNTFEAYNAEDTSGLNMRGFFGAVFDGRYVYFVPQNDGQLRHGRVMRYDSHSPFNEPKSWQAYDAGQTDGLKTIGYYGGVFDGSYVYFIPRTDGSMHHSRILRYDIKEDFMKKKAWSAYNAGLNVSYQSAGFDGRYIYFAPGYEGAYSVTSLLPDYKGEKGDSGKVLRYDTNGNFSDPASYAVYDAGDTGGLNSRCYDGVVFDGRYIYFIPLEPIGIVLRYDTENEFSERSSWTVYDYNRCSEKKMGKCVGATFDGRYIYFCPYSISTYAVRYDTCGSFTARESWQAYDAGNTDGLLTKGYDGAAFDGRYIYYIPFWEGKSVHYGFHGKVLRYDTKGDFLDKRSWQAHDAGNTSGLKTIGFNAGAFDGRYLYFAPWREELKTGPDEGFKAHGKVLRYDTTGSGASFSLRAADFGHNGGLCAALPGPSFLINTPEGVFNVRANKVLSKGRHHLAGVYNGSKLSLYLDGELVAEQEGSGKIQENDTAIAVGKFQDGLGCLSGNVSGLRISDCARSAAWIKAEFLNQKDPKNFIIVGAEEIGYEE